uniref:Galectin n=1 Tax=Rhinolophus ferrumequinum TaxID=59479 RepID=A0A671DV68_RHIFE
MGAAQGPIFRVESSDSWCVSSQDHQFPGPSSCPQPWLVFVLNLGKDSNNVCLHFNPRFDIHGDTNTIVCNSKDDGVWGTELREPAFPFQPGSVTEVCISFDQADLSIKLPDGYTFKFPNRLNLEAINYLAAEGDFKIKCVAFE